MAFAPALTCPLRCVEPDPRMAAVLRRNTAAYPLVSVEVGRFEDWRPDRRYGLLYAASCWQWLDPARRWDLAHAALAPGGTLAFLGNPARIVDPDLLAGLLAIERDCGIDSSPHLNDGDLTRDIPDGPNSPAHEAARDDRFTDLRPVRLRHPVRLGTRAYQDYLASLSAYRIAPAANREHALERVGALLDAHGGGIDVDRLNDIVLARAR